MLDYLFQLIQAQIEEIWQQCISKFFLLTLCNKIFKNVVSLIILFESTPDNNNWRNLATGYF